MVGTSNQLWLLHLNVFQWMLYFPKSNYLVSKNECKREELLNSLYSTLVLRPEIQIHLLWQWKTERHWLVLQELCLSSVRMRAFLCFLCGTFLVTFSEA